MSDDFVSLTELGELYGVTSHKVGRWLKDLGLRDQSGRPSREAFSDGFVAQRESTRPGTYFYVWNLAKTTVLLDKMGYPRA